MLLYFHCCSSLVAFRYIWSDDSRPLLAEGNAESVVDEHPSPKSTSAFAQAKERFDDVVMETLVSKDDPKDIAERDAEAVAVDQSNSKPATASALAREDFNDAIIEDASMKGEPKDTKGYDDEDSSCGGIAKSA